MRNFSLRVYPFCILSFDVSDWAVEAVQWAVGSGLMKGDGVSLTPNSNATRCQSAALLMRFCEDIMKKR